MRDKSALLIFALLLAAVAGMGGVILGSASRGSFSSEGSTYRAAPDGARGLYLFSEALGMQVSRRHVSLEVVEEDPGSIIVLLGINAGRSCEMKRPHGHKKIEPPSSEDAEKDRPTSIESLFAPVTETKARLSPLECLALREWIFEGGSLVHVAGSHDALLSALGIRFRAAKGREQETANLVPGQPSPLVSGVGEVRAPFAGFVSASDGDQIVLLETLEDKSRPVAIARRHGKGRIFVISAPALSTNQWLAEADNSVFWASLLRGIGEAPRMVFVEHHHGHADQRGIMGYVLGRGLLPVVLQIMLVFLVGIAAATRLGLPFSASRDRARAEGDLLSAMSRIYALGNHACHAGETIAARALEHAASLRLDPSVGAAITALEKSLEDLRGRSEAQAAGRSDLEDVARRAAAVYDAVEARRRPKARGKKARASVGASV